MRPYILLLLVIGPLCLHAQPLPPTLGFQIGSRSWEWKAHRDQLLYDQILAVETGNFSRKYVAKLNGEIPVVVGISTGSDILFPDDILRLLRLDLVDGSPYESGNGIPAAWVESLRRLLVSSYGPPDHIEYNSNADYNPLLAYTGGRSGRPVDNLNIWKEHDFEVILEYSHVYPENNRHSYAYVKFRPLDYDYLVAQRSEEIMRNAKASDLLYIELSSPRFRTIPPSQRKGMEDKIVYSEVQTMFGTDTLSIFNHKSHNASYLQSATIDLVYKDTSGRELMRIAGCTIQLTSAVSRFYGLNWYDREHVCGTTYVSSHPQAQPIERAAASGAYIRHEVYVQKVILGDGTVITR